MTDHIEMHAELRPISQQLDVYVIHKDDKGQAVGRIEYGPIADGRENPPTLRLYLTEAQQLMDEFWRCGLRPSEGSGSAGSLAATERHLADMRRLVEKGMGVTL